MEVHLRDLFSRFQEQFGAGPGLGPSSGTCLLRADGGADPALIRSLFRAAAALSRTDPWKRLRPAHLLGVRVGRDADWGASRRQPFPCAQFVGGDGGDLALHLFRSEQDALRATAPLETRRIPNLELLRVVFLPEPLLSHANRRMVRSLSLEASAAAGGAARFPVVDVTRVTASGGGVRFRNPTLEELRFLYAVMKAAALVHPLLSAADEGAPPRRGRPLAFNHFIETVDIEWPPEMSRGSALVAVTISHPPGEVYDERKPSPSPTRYAEPLPPSPAKEDVLPETEAKAAAPRAAALRQCALCEKDVHGEQSLCCGRCRAVVYCSSACQKQHWKETHRPICGLYKAMMEREEELAINIFVFPCFIEHPCKWLESVGVHQKGMWRRKCSCYAHCPYGLLPTPRNGGHSESWGGLSDGDYPPDSAFPNYRDGGAPSPALLSGWSEYYALRSLPMSSPAAAILSHPLTVYHILTALAMDSKSRLVKGREVVVHYLGPEGELDWMPAFMEIGHLLNGSGSVQFFMVGPEVPSSLSGTASGGGGVKVNLVSGVYQEEAACLPLPNVVLALNCGLESYGGGWGAALDTIRSLDVPAFFTDRSELACAKAKQVLRGAGLHITHPVTPNPFRSPVRHRMPSANLPSFSNGFVFGVGVHTMRKG